MADYAYEVEIMAGIQALEELIATTSDRNVKIEAKRKIGILKQKLNRERARQRAEEQRREKEQQQAERRRARRFAREVKQGRENTETFQNLSNPFYSFKKRMSFIKRNNTNKDGSLDVKGWLKDLGSVIGPSGLFVLGVKGLAAAFTSLKDSVVKGTEAFNDLANSLETKYALGNTEIGAKTQRESLSDALDKVYNYRQADTWSFLGTVGTDITNKLNSLVSGGSAALYASDLEKSLKASSMAKMAGFDTHAQAVIMANAMEFAENMTQRQYEKAGVDLLGTYGMDVLWSTSEFQEFYNNALDAILTGGKVKGTEFSLEGATAENYKLGILPNMSNSQGLLSEANSEYLIKLLAKLKTNGEAGLRSQQTNDMRQTRLLKNMMGTLYSFDEVVTNNAVNEAENLVEQQEMNSTLLKVSEDANAAADEAANNALLEQRKTDAVKKAIEDDKLTAEEIRELETMMDDTEIAKRLLDLEGIPATEEAINGVLTMLNTTLESGIPVNLGSLSDSLDTFSKAMEGGIKLDGNIIVNGHEYTKEQSDAFRLAIADGVFSDEEYDKLLEMGWDRADIIAILATLKNIEVQTKDLDKVVKARTEFDVLRDMLSNPLYSQKAIDEQRKIVQKYAAETGDGLTMDPMTNMLQINKKYGSVQLYNALNGNGSLNNNTVTQQQEDEEIARLMAANNVLEAIYGNGQAAGGIGTDDSVIRAFEKGPEAIIPLNDSGIQFMTDAIKNANIEGGLGGGDVHVNLTLSGLNISDKRDWEDVGLKIGQVIQNYKNRTGGI